MNTSLRSNYFSACIIGLICTVLTGCVAQPQEINESIPSVGMVTTKQPVLRPVLMDSPIIGIVVYSILHHESDPWTTQLFIKDLTTGEIIELTEPGENADDPIWSPDGAWVLYSSWTKENLSDLCLMNSDGSNKHSLVSGPANEYMADWSVDGKKIVYVSDADGDNDLYVLDIQTQKSMKLTDGPGRYFSPKWSVDGSRIAYISNSSENQLDGRSQVYVMKADGSDIRQWTEYDLDHFEDSPVWCPDDSCILFTRSNGPLKMMKLDFPTQSVTPLFDQVFGPTIQEATIGRSPISGLITFSAGDDFYAMNMETMEVFPINVEGAFRLALYP